MCCCAISPAGVDTRVEGEFLRTGLHGPVMVPVTFIGSEAKPSPSGRRKEGDKGGGI